MKNVIVFSFVLIFSVTTAFAGSVNEYGNNVDISEYPESVNVEPLINNSQTLEAGIENVIEVNLDDCLRLALGNNPKIQAAMQDVFASDARIKQVWSNYFPQFSWQTGYSRIRQLQLSDVFRENLIYNFWVLGQISGSQLLYDFGVTKNQALIRTLDKEGYKIILTNVINDVVYKVKDAYFNLLYALEAQKIEENNVREYEVFYEQAKKFYSSGVKPKIDVTIAEVNLSNSKLMLIQANHAVSIAMANLNNIIGIPYFMKYSVSDNLKYEALDINVEKAVELCEKSRSEFELADIKVEQAKQNIKLVKKVWFPQFITQGQFEVGGRHPDSNYGYTLGAYLNFPVINGMQIKYQLREAKILYSKSQSEAKSTKNNIYLQVQNAFYLFDENKNKLPVAFFSMKQAKENYLLSSGRYKAGVGNPTELNDAQISYNNAQLTYYKTLYEYNTSRAALEKSIGRNLTDGVIDLDCKNKQN